MLPIMTSAESITPAFPDCPHVISLASSNEYVKYLCVYLHSLIQHASPASCYDIVIFERDISAANKAIIKRFAEQDNISIRFYNPMPLFEGVKLHISLHYFKEECYFRIAAPVVFHHYQKIIYTDLDIILRHDILDLLRCDMGGRPLAAALEPVWREMYDDNPTVMGVSIRQYTDHVLGLPHPYEYFNTGVCLMDVAAYNRENAFEHILSDIRHNSYIYQEQCALNTYFKGRIAQLPAEWNYELAPPVIESGLDYYAAYRTRERGAHLLHYLGGSKPWASPHSYLADLWWQHARHTPFYEDLLMDIWLSAAAQERLGQALLQGPLAPLSHYVQRLEAHASRHEQQISLLEQQQMHLIHSRLPEQDSRLNLTAEQLRHSIVLTFWFYFRVKKTWYRLKKHLHKGKKREKYRKKYDAVRRLMREARQLKHSITQI